MSRYPEAMVVNLDFLTYAGNPASLEDLGSTDRYQFQRGDIGDNALVRTLLMRHQPQCVFNFAAESHVDRSIDSPNEFIQTNVVGTANLLGNTLDYWNSLAPSRQLDFRFIHVSTDEVYGSLGPNGRFTEETRYQPNSPYSASKAASDHFVRAYRETYGLPTLISNCSNNYGPFQFPEKLIPLMTLNAIEGKPLPVYGDGANVRDWLFVTDHCDALIEIWKQGRIGEVYNIGGNAEQSNLEVVQTICAVVDELRPGMPHGPSADLIEFVTDRPGHDRRYAIDAAKIQSETSWEPMVSFDEGIRKTVQWYMDNSCWVESVSSCSGRNRKGLADFLGSRGVPLNSTRQREVAETQAVGEIHDVVVKPLKEFSDERGWLIELFRADEINEEHLPQMAYVSQTEPGVVRGPHEHAEQADYFAFVGPGDFELTLWDARPQSPTFGIRSNHLFGESSPAAVVVPAGVVHAYKNISEFPGWVFNAPNRLYAGEGKSGPIDEIRHEEISETPYRLS